MSKKVLERYRITDVDVWNATGIDSKKTVLVEDGIVSGIADRADVWSEEPGVRTVDGSGRILMPLGVDPQVHLRVPGQPEKETAATGLAAALKGGIGALLTMPNTKPVLDSVESCELAYEALRGPIADTGVKVLLSVAMTRGQKGKEPVDFDALREYRSPDPDFRVAAFTDDGVGVVDDDLMRAVFRASQRTALPVLQHAEYPGHPGVLAEGPVQQKSGMPAYPAEAEYEMVARDLRLLVEFPKARYHVLHVSSARTLELIVEARAKGLYATCEASPHHLYFTSDDIREDNLAFKMNPPLRSAGDRLALRRGLAEGAVDFVATDHAPHESQVKSKDFKTAAYGTTGLETSLRVLFSMYKAGELTPERLVDVFSTCPAEFLGLGEEHGRIAKGLQLRAALVDPAFEAPVTEEDLASLSKNNCFLGTVLPARVERAFIGTLTHSF